MGRSILIAALLLITLLSAKASDSTSTEVQLNPKKSGAAFLIDLGFNNFLKTNDPYKLKAIGSRGANFYYMYKIRLGYFLSISPGLGLGFDNYSFQNENLRLTPAQGILITRLDTTPNV
ncbi:MAG TPA: hypothetical protein VF691_07430, partial [Cytophagaceae bacterium]